MIAYESHSAERGIEFTSPRPAEGETTVEVRRDILVILSFNKEILSRGSATYNGLKIPCTPSVDKQESESGKKLLHLQIRVLGATTETSYKTLCHKCKKRAGDKDAFPDFRATSNIVVPKKNGKLRVAFKLACCSEHREPPGGQQSAHGTQSPFDMRHACEFNNSNRITFTIARRFNRRILVLFPMHLLSPSSLLQSPISLPLILE